MSGHYFRITCKRGESDPDEGRFLCVKHSPSAPGHVTDPSEWRTVDTEEEARRVVEEWGRG